MRQDGLVDRIM